MNPLTKCHTSFKTTSTLQPFPSNLHNVNEPMTMDHTSFKITSTSQPFPSKLHNVNEPLTTNHPVKDNAKNQTTVLLQNWLYIILKKKLKKSFWPQNRLRHNSKPVCLLGCCWWVVRWGGDKRENIHDMHRQLVQQRKLWSGSHKLFYLSLPSCHCSCCIWEKKKEEKVWRAI